MSNKKQLKVLVADDDDAIRLALKTMIESEGFSVFDTANGIAAMEVYERESPDIILLDTIMPEMNGYQVCETIRKNVPDIHELPIVMITMMDDLDSIKKAQNLGASDYIIKPIQWPLLMYRLNVLFHQKKLLEEKNKIEEKLRHTYKLSAIRQLTGGFAHDFNNILATQLGYTELALNHDIAKADEKFTHYLGEVQKASLRGKILIEHLMTFAMDGLDLNSVSEVKSDFTDSIKAILKIIPSHITFDSECHIDNEWIGIDFVQFHQILMNLIENSIDAIEKEGNVSVSLEKRFVDKKVCASCLSEIRDEYIVLSVSDSGTGINDNILQQIFEPFFSTKPVGKATGHGMSVIHGIVHAAGGHILVNSEPHKGCTIEVCFIPISAVQQMAV